MRRWLTIVAVLGVLAPGLVADEPKGRTEQELLAELKKLAAPPERTQLKGLDADEVRDFYKERAENALRLARTFEEQFPKSAALAEARSEALKAVATVEDDEVAEASARLARALRDGAAKGSDHAAQADLFLLGQDFRKSLRGAKSLDDLRTAWTKHADGVRKEVEAYLTAYPKYRPGADAMARLAHLAQVAGDDKTERLVTELVAKNFPEHPLARAAARAQAVGKEFDFAYTPLGADAPTSLKALRGKVVVVYFWAVYSVPCKAENKHVQELYDRYHKDGLEVVGISLDEKEELVPKFVKVKKVEWPQWVGKDARRFAEEWGVESLPAEFVIDRKGRLHSGDALANLEELLPELLKEKN